MRVTIWDLDYYYAGEKVNIFNPDVMKISSYHKQRGDIVTFVVNEFDIRRAYDLYYIIKEDKKTPNPPMDFFTNKSVRWWGSAVKQRIKWSMDYAMLCCRPDYLLYPEKNTKLERAEHIRFFDDNAQLLPRLQDWTNTFKNKMLIVTDKNMWKSDSKSIIQVLKALQTMKNVTFLEPILIQKIISDKNIINEFLKIKFTRGTEFNWTEVGIDDIDATLDFMVELKKVNNIYFNPIVFDYSSKNKYDHWTNKDNAFRDFEIIRNVIKAAKDRGIEVKIHMPVNRFITPYFELFEELSYWSEYAFTMSWLEYITKKFTGGKEKEDYWNNPRKWSEVYRDLLLQTYKYKDLLLQRNKDDYVSEALIPWKLWESEFKYEI